MNGTGGSGVWIDNCAAKPVERNASGDERCVSQTSARKEVDQEQLARVADCGARH